MGLETLPLPSLPKGQIPVQFSDKPSSLNSMSQDYHQGIFGFSNGFERPPQQEQQHHHIAHQIRREKLRAQGGFDPPAHIVGIVQEEDDETGVLPGYETAGMLSEMFNFPPGPATATELLENQISAGNYRNLRSVAGASYDWYGKNTGAVNDGDSIAIATHHQQQHQNQMISGINGDSAAAMQLFLMNPQQQPPPRSPSPPPPPPPQPSSTLHMLLPNPTSNSTLQGFHNPSQFNWIPEGGPTTAAQLHNPNEIGGLSLSLSSTLQHLEAAKVEELRIGESGMLFFNQGGGEGGPSSSTHHYGYKNFGGANQNNQANLAYSSSMGVVNVLRNSKYAKAAQELLEEFCSVGRGQFKKNSKLGKQLNANPIGGNGDGSGGASSSSSKDPPPPLSSADRIEHQRRKVKLLPMLDEVERRYNHYCEQMQMVVNSFDLMMGFGSAVPYTALAQKAMSRHFRCLKDAIAAQLKHSCELLGEKDAGSSGVTKGETPRLKLLEQSLRQQRAFNQMSLMEQEAWRPQRGLPERSVNILRAWLFEHFLHPYPSDADKHLLARQTGLSRNQVSNWFINARVRLWKPMVEDMYQQEAKEEAEEEEREMAQLSSPSAPTQTPTPPTTTNTATATTTQTTGKRSEFNATESDPSLIAINRQCFLENQSKQAFISSNPSMSTHILSSATSTDPTVAAPADHSFPAVHGFENCGATGDPTMSSTLIRFGTTAGDVSLTLGLRHAGNLPDNNPFFS